MNTKEDKRKYHYFYKITNNINGHFYYGVHCTDNLDDGYMGSGKRLHYAYKKYGIENFTKEILKYFDTKQEALEYEASIVTEALVKDDQCYNLTLGGYAPWYAVEGKVQVYDTLDPDKKCFLCMRDDPLYLSGRYQYIHKGKAVYKDKDGNVIHTNTNDPKVLSGEYTSIIKGKTRVFDKDGSIIWISVNDPRFISGELKSVQIGIVNVEDQNGHRFQTSRDDPRIHSGEIRIFSSLKDSVMCRFKDGHCEILKRDDPRYISGEAVPNTKGYVTVRDKKGNYFNLSKEDPTLEERLKTGEIVYAGKGKKRSDEFRQLISQYASERKGEKSSCYGKVWIHKMIDRKVINKKVYPNDVEQFLSDGWILGGKRKEQNETVWINKDCVNKIVNSNEIESYIRNGWQKGMKRHHKV